MIVRWTYTLLQIVLLTTEYTQGLTESPESATATKTPNADDGEAEATQALTSDFTVFFNGNITGIRTLNDDTHQKHVTNRGGNSHDTKDEVTIVRQLDDITRNNSTSKKDYRMYTQEPVTYAENTTKDDIVTVFILDDEFFDDVGRTANESEYIFGNISYEYYWDSDNSTIFPEVYDLSSNETIAPTIEPHYETTQVVFATAKPSISSNVSKPEVSNITETDIPEAPYTTMLTPNETIAPTNEPPHETTELIVAITNQTISPNVSKTDSTDASSPEFPEYPSTTLSPHVTNIPALESTNKTMQLYNVTTNPPMSSNSSYTGVTNISVQAGVSLVCGVNTMTENGACACSFGWAADPLVTSAIAPLNCSCPDLCATVEGDYCPQNAVCAMESCNRKTCICETGLFYNRVQKKCIGVCEYYGRSLCRGANEKCVPADGGFQCHCQDGFARNGKDCTDINECSNGEVCQANEECHNNIGSSLCACKPGFFRAQDGKCQNVNECLAPSLHDCDQLCEDRSPPERYDCSCFQGFSWNDTQRICTRDAASSLCECTDPSKSVCVLVTGLSQQKQCYPKPGWQGDDGKIQDVNECVTSTNVEQWCGANSYCMNSKGSAKCVCRDGFANTTVNYGQCDAVTCPSGQVASGSQCVGACSMLSCNAPYSCVVNNDGTPGCRCMSECLQTTQPMSPLSIYHGAFTLKTEEGDRDILIFDLTSTLELVFDAGKVEILEVTSSLRSKRQTQVTYDVEFIVIQERGDLSEELSSLLKKACLELPSGNDTCALPGGTIFLKDSITLAVRDPCSPSPCPGSLFACTVRPGTAGRADCGCKDGYFNIPVTGAMGVCEDVDECALSSHNCTGDCINTPGGFFCRDVILDIDTTEKNFLAGGGATHRDLAITFGVLFILCLCVAIGLATLLLKRNNRTGEMIPMNSNGNVSVGVDNQAYMT